MEKAVTSKKCFTACTNSEDSDQPAHPRSLIRVFIVSSKEFTDSKELIYGKAEILVSLNLKLELLKS